MRETFHQTSTLKKKKLVGFRVPGQYERSIPTSKPVVENCDDQLLQLSWGFLTFTEKKKMPSKIQDSWGDFEIKWWFLSKLMHQKLGYHLHPSSWGLFFFTVTNLWNHHPVIPAHEGWILWRKSRLSSLISVYSSNYHTLKYISINQLVEVSKFKVFTWIAWSCSQATAARSPSQVHLYDTLAMPHWKCTYPMAFGIDDAAFSSNLPALL